MLDENGAVGLVMWRARGRALRLSACHISIWLHVCIPLQHCCVSISNYREVCIDWGDASRNPWRNSCLQALCNGTPALGLFHPMQAKPPWLMLGNGVLTPCRQQWSGEGEPFRARALTRRTNGPITSPKGQCSRARSTPAELKLLPFVLQG